MGETLGRGVIIEVLGTRGEKLYNNWELEPNAQAVAVTESPYSSFLDIIFPPKHNHRFSTKWTAGKEGHYHACLNSTCPLTNEKDMDGYTAHTYGDWKVTVYATDSKEGSRKKTCTVCGYEYTQTIPKGAYDGSKLDDPTNPGGKGGTGTGTGQGGSAKATAPSAVKGLSVKNPKAKTTVVKWTAVSGADGYEVSYTTDKKFKKGIKKKDAKSATLTIKKLKKKKTYYFKVRAYKNVSGKKVYGELCKAKKVKIKK